VSKTQLRAYDRSLQEAIRSHGWLTRQLTLQNEWSVEVSGTIIERVGDRGFYSVDALTNHGWLRALALECEEGQREWIIRQLAELRQQRWHSVRESVVIEFSEEFAVVPHTAAAEASPRDVSTNSRDESRNSWVSSPDEILHRLESDATPADERITAVVFAETTSFSESQKPRVRRSLFDFCNSNRFATNDDVVTAVAAAIRKFAMNMPTSEFESYSNLFLPTETQTLSCDIELELAKAIGWRLVRVPHIDGGTYPTLASRLEDLASDYLVARLILQENHASTAMHAVTAVGLLKGRRQDELIDRVAEMGIGWFTDLLSRRLLDVINKRLATARPDDGNLRRLYERLARHVSRDK
jgi:hypothetical protein